MKYSLTWYLNKYNDWQDNIILVSRPDTKHTWSDRCLFLEEGYSPQKHYNHRSLLYNEVVIEYDYDDMELNKELARRASIKLRDDGYSFARWSSGNKSHHVHFFIDVRESKNIPLLKNITMKRYGRFFRKDGRFISEYEEGCEVLMPDLRLASVTHLIRAEYGIHEKTGKNKSLIHKSADYPRLNELSEEVWRKYSSKQAAIIRRRMTMTTKDLKDSELVKQLLDTTKFRETVGDGRERIMFCLIHLIKHKYQTKEELTKYLWDWYKYTSGYKMTEQDVVQKVRYHWARQYTITHTYLQRVYEDVTGHELKMEEK